jgi:signal transduction histidine kinase/ligand-binding sensor domain-containing protein
LLIALFPFFAGSQINNFSFTNYTTANGLCYNDVFDILQDSRGFMWFGTAEGLSRFDGSNFKNFYARMNENLSFPSNHITNLHEYKKGHLVFMSGTRLWCFNTITLQFYAPNQFEGKFLRSIGDDKKGHYYIHVTDTCFITNNQLQITDTIVQPAKSRPAVNTLTYLAEKTTFVYTKQEIFNYDIYEKKYANFQTPNIPIRGYDLHCGLINKKDKYLFYWAYGAGIYKVSFEGKQLFHWSTGTTIYGLSSATISSLLQENDSTLWVGTVGDGFGLNIININTNTVTQVFKNDLLPSSLVSNEINYIYKDAAGNIWLATRRGISKLSIVSTNIKNWYWQFAPDDNHKELINIIKGPDENMYMGFYGGNTYQLNIKKNSVIKLQHSMAGSWSLHTHGDELFKTGVGNAVVRYNTKTAKYTKLDFLQKYFPDVELIVSGFIQRSGDKWYSANQGGGFVRIDAKDGSYHTYKKDGEHGKFIWSYYTYHTETANGDLWFGVNKTSTLLHWNKALDHFSEIEFDNVKGTKPTHFGGINAVTCDRDNNIWIGFAGNGVVVYNPVADTAYQYTIEQGLLSNYIMGLQFDGNNRLWIASANALSCLLADRKKIISFKKEDGLPEDHFEENCSYFDSSVNKLWIGATSTLLCFDPDVLLSFSKSKFPVYVDGFFVNGKKFVADSLQNISLKPSQNNLFFQFIAVDLANAKDIEYSYRLVGADEDWVYNGSLTSASYANLIPGTYRFAVRARHKGDIIWTALETPVLIVIETPWNKTWWFKLLLILAFGFIIWFVIRLFYLRKLEKQQAIIEKQAAISNERSRIASDMHDDMGTGLSRMRYLSTAIKNEVHDIGLQQDIEKLITGSDELVDQMNEIIWTLQNSDETLEETIYYIRSQCSEMLDHANIGFAYNLPESVPKRMVSSEEKRNLYLVVKEAVHNVVKHAQASRVSLSVEITHRLKIIVADNGKGFDVDKNKLKGNGLSNYEKRMRVLKGSVHIRSDANGTTVYFDIPFEKSGM